MAELTEEQKAIQAAEKAAQKADAEAKMAAEKAEKAKAEEFAEAAKKPGRYIVEGGRLVDAENNSVLAKDGQPLIAPK